MLRIPGAHKFYRAALKYSADTLLSPIMRSIVWRRLVEHYGRYNLRREVTKKELIKKLMPTYPIGCKRIILDNDFHRLLNHTPIHLTIEPIKSIKDHRIETESGTIPTDMIIYATGFRAPEFSILITV